MREGFEVEGPEVVIEGVFFLALIENDATTKAKTINGEFY